MTDCNSIGTLPGCKDIEDGWGWGGGGGGRPVLNLSKKIRTWKAVTCYVYIRRCLQTKVFTFSGFGCPVFWHQLHAFTMSLCLRPSFYDF